MVTPLGVWMCSNKKDCIFSNRLRNVSEALTLDDVERGAIVRLPDAKVGNLLVLFAVEPPSHFSLAFLIQWTLY